MHNIHISTCYWEVVVLWPNGSELFFTSYKIDDFINYIYPYSYIYPTIMHHGPGGTRIDGSTTVYVTHWEMLSLHFLVDTAKLYTWRLKHGDIGGMKWIGYVGGRGEKPMMTSSNWSISALLVFCEENPPVTSGFPSQTPVTRGFSVFLCAPEQTVEQTIEALEIWDAMALIVTSL